MPFVLALQGALELSALALTVNAPVPGRVGRDNTVLVTGADPGVPVYLVLGRPGGIPIPPCPGLTSEVKPDLMAGPVVASAEGEATFVLAVPAAAGGRPSGLQAFQRPACTLSAALWITWPDPFTRSLGDADALLLGTEANDYAGYNLDGVGDVDGDGFTDVVVVAQYAGYGTGITYFLRGPLSGVVALADADARMVAPPTPQDGSTREAAGVGDVNGDGFGDLLVGGPISGTDPGRAYLLHGPPSGTFLVEDRAEAQFFAEGYDDGVGTALASAGDVDGDGNIDLLLGTKQNRQVGQWAGAAYLVHGPVAGNVHLSTADARMYGEGERHGAGSSVLGAGDVDGDGIADIVVTAPGYQHPSEGYTSRGAVYLLHGPVTGTMSLADSDVRMFGELEWDLAGTVSGNRDMDTDGVPELVVGVGVHPVATREGAVYVVRPPANGDLSLGEADAVLLGVHPLDYAGLTVASLDDVNDDGFDDLLVGTDGEGSYLVVGPVSGTMSLGDADVVFVTETEDDGGGIRVADVGDTNADGFGDMMVSAPYRDGEGGREVAGGAYLLLGGEL